MKTPKHILPVIVLAQFLCTSLWFATNGIIDQLVNAFNLPETALGNLVIAIQMGFILGTLCYAFFNIADRFSPSRVFFISAVLAAFANFSVCWGGNLLWSILTLRFLTGFFLAGIYPVGMKIAADYFEKGLGKSLGFLVGALVVGTALPHLLNGVSSSISWQLILQITSVLSILGGLLILLFVPNGPYRKPAQKLELYAIKNIFAAKKFRRVAFGYFGHMWELYTFWALLPLIVETFNELSGNNLNISIYTFSIIGVGGVACMFSGYISTKIGPRKTAKTALLISALCCLLSPLILSFNALIPALVFLHIWGAAVVADSPMLSTLVANNAYPQLKGTALTIVNCLGYLVTIISLQIVLVNINYPYYYLLLLAIGPILGFIALYKTKYD
ncbi:membrane protein [Croceivirga lutea]|uniref:MFS transporter n=1 Tax=Croceivirga lutea TaxID=1775167 RepID=UPI001639F544|nr:MFS transporter [Croceivirga lutea]GGG40490.1 membrane protein [Croceivirga lutea]